MRWSPRRFSTAAPVSNTWPSTTEYTSIVTTIRYSYLPFFPASVVNLQHVALLGCVSFTALSLSLSLFPYADCRLTDEGLLVPLGGAAARDRALLRAAGPAPLLLRPADHLLGPGLNPVYRSAARRLYLPKSVFLVEFHTHLGQR